MDILKSLEDLAERIKIPTEIVLREYFQKNFLIALSWAGIYDNYVFQGGTAIRFFYDSPRFSIDLDFTVLDPLRISIDMKKVFRKFEDLILSLGFDIRVSRISLQRFVISVFLNKGKQIDIKLDILARQDRKSLRFDTKMLESEYPIKTIFPINVKVGSQLLADKVTSLAGGHAKEHERFRDIFDIYWLSNKGYTIDNVYLKEIFSTWRETLESLKEIINIIESLKPRDIIQKIGVLLPYWLRSDKIAHQIKTVSLRVLKEALAILTEE